MTDAVQIAIVGGLCTAIPVMFGQWVVARSASRKADTLAQQSVDQITEVADRSATKVAEVHTLVNSQMATALREIEALKAKVTSLGGDPEVPQ